MSKDFNRSDANLGTFLNMSPVLYFIDSLLDVHVGDLFT